MAVSTRTKKLIESGNHEALEDQWLLRLEEATLDLDYFVGAARALAGNGEESRAAELLELLDDHLTGAGDWSLRANLLRRAGNLLLAGDDLHHQIVETLRKLFPKSAISEPLLDKLGLQRGVGNIEKTWQKADRYRALMQFDQQPVVWMEGKGAGRVAEINIALERLKVDFERHPGLSVGFSAASKVLRVLDPDHLLYRKLTDLENLQRQAKEQPAEFVQLVLQSLAESATAGEIRQAVIGIIAEKAWTSWWSKARSLPQVVSSGKGAKQVYSWAASAEAAGAASLLQFGRATLSKQLEIYRREAKRGGTSTAAMQERLLEQLRAAVAKTPAEAFAISAALERAGADCPPELQPSEILKNSREPVDLVVSLEDKPLRKQAAQLMRAEHPDWIASFRQLMSREGDPGLLTEISRALQEQAPEVLEECLGEIVAHARKRAAAFVWLAEHLPSFPALEERDPLRLMRLIFEAPRAAEFAPFKARLAKVVEESPALPQLIARLQPEQAGKAEELLKTAMIEDYVRTPLINSLHVRFPESRTSEDDFLYAMPASIDQRRRELKELMEVEIPANRRAIEAARELGDLRENFEYKSARQRHEYLSARATKLDADLRRTRAIDPQQIDGGEMRVGTRANLVDTSSGQERTLSILGPWESDPDAGIVSYESEGAQSLLGLTVGDEWEFDGRSWRIDGIETISAD